MNLTSADRCKNADVNFSIIRKTAQIWVSMKNVHNGLGVKNMSDLVLKEIYGRYGTKNLKNNEIKKCKMTEREIFKKYDNLSENELNTKSNKEVDVRNDVITSVIMHCRGEKKEEKEK